MTIVDKFPVLCGGVIHYVVLDEHDKLHTLDCNGIDAELAQLGGELTPCLMVVKSKLKVCKLSRGIHIRHATIFGMHGHVLRTAWDQRPFTHIFRWHMAELFSHKHCRVDYQLRGLASPDH